MYKFKTNLFEVKQPNHYSKNKIISGLQDGSLDDGATGHYFRVAKQKGWSEKTLRGILGDSNYDWLHKNEYEGHKEGTGYKGFFGLKKRSIDLTKSPDIEENYLFEAHKPRKQYADGLSDPDNPKRRLFPWSVGKKTGILRKGNVTPTKKKRIFKKKKEG